MRVVQLLRESSFESDGKFGWRFRVPVLISVVGDSWLHGSEFELHLQNGDSQNKTDRANGACVGFQPPGIKHLYADADPRKEVTLFHSS